MEDEHYGKHFGRRMLTEEQPSVEEERSMEKEYYGRQTLWKKKGSVVEE